MVVDVVRQTRATTCRGRRVLKNIVKWLSAISGFVDEENRGAVDDLRCDLWMICKALKITNRAGASVLLYTQKKIFKAAQASPI
jgi:hypothetical protein